MANPRNPPTIIFERELRAIDDLLMIGAMQG